jgi:transposase-like protein
MYEHQFKKLLLNIREISVHEVEAMGGFWFNKSINKAIINKYATFDKYKKKYVMKEDVTGIPVKRELLKSFAKTPDHYLRASDQMAMEITDRIRRWRELFFTSTFMTKIYKGLLTHLNSTLKKEFPKYLKELATHLKIMNILFEYDNVTL